MKGVIRLKDLRRVIRDRVRSDDPGYQIQENQINAVILALRSVVRRSLIEAINWNILLVTYDHFCCIENRSTIVRHISYASGLPLDLSEQVLISIEAYIDRGLADNQGYLYLDGFGMIESCDSGYRIHTAFHVLAQR